MREFCLRVVYCTLYEEWYDSTAQGNTKEWGHKQIKAIHTKYKQAKYTKHSVQPGCMNWSW